MKRGVIGAIAGLIIGWIAGNALQQAVDWIRADSLVIIAVAILGAVLGANIAGLSGGAVGAIAGLILGVLAVQLLFVVLKLVTMAFGAAAGWRLTTASD